MTWLMDDARPVSVTAVTQRIKPEIYAKVDDEATIILEYPGAQAIIQASWNWPFDRKDMEVYGRTGQVLTVAQSGLRVRLAGKPEEIRQAAAALAARGRLPPLFRRRRARRAAALGAVVAQEQPDRHRDPRRRPPLRRDREHGAAELSKLMRCPVIMHGSGVRPSFQLVPMALVRCPSPRAVL